MATKKDKWYIPSEFKNIKDKGVTQIIIGIVIAVFGAFTPSQGIFFVVGGIIWAFVGVCLVVAKYEDEKEKNEKEEEEEEEKEEEEEEEEEGEELSDDEVKAELKDLSIKVLLEENRKLADEINKLEKKTKNKK